MAPISTFDLLDQEEESAFHRQRLLPVENRPLRRPLDRLFTPSSLLFKAQTKTTTNRNTTDEAKEDKSTADDTRETISEQEETARQQWRDELLQELSLLESTMVRIQMLRRSNAIERERYAQSKLKILEAAQDIRSNTSSLRVRLDEAQNTMALRKHYDELTEKITSNRMLRPREDQMAQLDKLTGEIAELEQEALDYKQTWAERREQFGRIVDEGRQMLRLIKDEKEEAERKEGMDGGDDGDGEDETRTRGAGSTVGTPRPGGSTPLRVDDSHETGDRLLPPSFRLHSPSRTGSRAQTPLRTDLEQAKDSGDVDMVEATATPAAQSNAESDFEEGEAEEDDNADDMET